MAQQYDHPVFTKPPPDTKIWRYMCWDKKFVDLVREQRLWMSSLAMLEDKFEGKTPNIITEGLERTLRSAENDDERKTITDNIDRIRQFAAHFYPHYFVSCWSMNDVEKDLLWRAYTGGNARSVAIQSTSGILDMLLPDYVFLGAVRYIDFEREGFPDLNMLHWPMHKRPIYDDERELRALVSTEFSKHDPSAKDLANHLLGDGNDVRIFAPPIDVKALIQNIYLHPDASPDFAAEAKTYCAANGLPEPHRSRLCAVGKF